MNKDVVKVIPNCIEKLSKLTPAKLRENRKSMICFLPFVIVYFIHKERMANKQYEHEETMLQMEHEETMLQMEHEETMLQMEYIHKEKMEEIKANLLIRAKESEINEKDI